MPFVSSTRPGGLHRGPQHHRRGARRAPLRGRARSGSRAVFVADPRLRQPHDRDRGSQAPLGPSVGSPGNWTSTASPRALITYTHMMAELSSTSVSSARRATGSSFTTNETENAQAPSIRCSVTAIRGCLVARASSAATTASPGLACSKGRRRAVHPRGRSRASRRAPVIAVLDRRQRLGHRARGRQLPRHSGSCGAFALDEVRHDPILDILRDLNLRLDCRQRLPQSSPFTRVAGIRRGGARSAASVVCLPLLGGGGVR